MKDAGTGRLVVETDGTDISLKAGSDNMLVGAKDGAVTLYYDNAAKLATTATGVDVTGVITTDGMTTSANINFGDNDKALFGAGDDLQVYHDGSDSYVKDAGTGRLVIETNGTDVSLKSGSDNMLVATKDGSVELYHNGVKQLETTANGVQLTGATTETKTLEIGTGRSGDGVSLIDLTGDATYTDFGTRLIRNAGANAATELVHRGTGILALVAQDAGRIEFKVANTEKMRIDADGVTITDADNSQPRVIIKTTDAGSGSPFLDFIKDSASPADDDNLMVLRNLGDNDAGEVISYVTMVGRSSDVTDGTENGRLSFETYVDGTNAERMAINSDGSTNIVNARIGGSGTVSSTGSWTGSGDVVLHTTSPSLNLGAFGVVVSHTYRGVFLQIHFGMFTMKTIQVYI